MDDRKATRKIIVHCSDTNGGNAAAIRRFHMAPPPAGRGWEDIGYHYVIDQDGTVEPGRDEALIGSHCEGDNHDSLGVCMVGIAEFSEAQIDSLKHLLADLMNRYNLFSDHIFGHYEMKSGIDQHKSCPNLKGEYLRGLFKPD
jgi:N-acetylmuramoyl-L-alanine amidase